MVSAALLFFVLLYVEHSSVRAVKTLAVAAGIVDSERTLVGITDIRSDDHVRGDPDADVVILEYIDFNCIMCAVMQSTLNRVVRDKKVLVVSRHYPTTHNTSFERAVAAECAAQHGGEEAYFAFAEYLYKNQRTIKPQELASRITELGVDAERFDLCLSDGEMNRRVRRDYDEAVRLGATGTPFIVIIHDEIPVGISYALEYKAFLSRVSKLTGVVW